MTTQQIVIGTRRSQLAVLQAEQIAAALRRLYPDLLVRVRHFTTHGDRLLDRPLAEIGGKGVFTEALEQALQRGEIDCAVHSLKDLPTTLPDHLSLAAVPQRASPYDALISRHRLPVNDLPPSATIGTSSPRRAAQLRAIRPDLNVLSLRGNVPTRLEKLQAPESGYDALVLAVAGLERLAMAEQITQFLTPPLMVPAPAQGALAVQCRAEDAPRIALLAALEDMPTRLAVEAERAFLSSLAAGCSLPIGALATYHPASQRLDLIGRVSSPDGQRVIDLSHSAVVPTRGAAQGLGAQLAQQALEQGAHALLER
jgi:hydroxymethylbilane synthase